MAATKLDKFTNRNYEYVDSNDTFIGRGLQLNMMREEVNNVIDDMNDLLPGTGNEYQIPVANATGDGWNYSEGFKLTDGGLDQYGKEIILGADASDHLNRTDATNKSGIIVFPHYTNSEEHMIGMIGTSSGTLNNIAIGGGGSGYNAATHIYFFAASNNTTIGGTIIGSFDIDGFHVNNISEYTTDAGVTINDEVYMPTIGGTGTGTSMIYYNRTTGELTYGDSPTGGSTYTFEGGLTEGVAGSVTLGGALIGINTLTMDETSNLLITGDRSGVGSMYSQFTYNNLVFSISASSPFDQGDARSEIYATNTTAGLRWYNAGYTASGISFTASAMQVQDAINAKGLVYVANYDTAGILDDNWIPSYRAVKAYADSVVGGTPYPAGSGIPIVVSGTSWGTTITDNSTNWDSAYSHISLTNNPHSVDANDILPTQTGHSGEFLTTNGSVLSWAASGGSGTVTSVSSSTTGQLTVANPTTTPALTIVTAAVANGETGLATGDQIYDFVIARGYSTTVGTVTSVSGTGTVDGLTLSGTVTSSGNLTLSGNVNVTSVTGTLPVANGGTGLATVGINRILTGNGTGALTAEANLTFTGSTLAVTGAITATGEITAYSSDRRLKTDIERIVDPVAKIMQLDGVTYRWRPDVCAKVGFTPAHEVETGMIAQNLGSVIKDAIAFAPFDRDYDGNSISGEDYLTVKLEKSIPVIIEALKEVITRLEKVENQ